jgi:5'-phosphate synthase pdxT subunit
LDGLIIPGGESTTICRLMEEYGLAEPLRRLAQDSFPVWGTCAGMIVLARHASDLEWPTLDALDISVRRNAFGRQVDSFEADLSVPSFGDAPFHGVFIRAPLVEEVGNAVEVLATLEDGRVVAVRQGQALATAFHPELTDDDRFHRYFMELVRAREQENRDAGF